MPAKKPTITNENCLKKWNPFADFGNLPIQWNTLLPLITAGTNGSTNLINGKDWQPAADIEEDEQQYLITVDLAIVKEEDVKISII